MVKSAYELEQSARRIVLVLTDNDGVLTDTGVYYSGNGEELKRYSVRDGMGVERLRKLAGVEVGIITGEQSASVERRAEKLNITELHLGIKDKMAVLHEIAARNKLELDQIAYIGDDTNDLEVMEAVGLSACPQDAMRFALDVADYICDSPGGRGAFRDLAEFIISARQETSSKRTVAGFRTDSVVSNDASGETKHG